jgi:hypothetical protein
MMTRSACNAGCEGNVVTIVLHVRGEEVTMRSCSACDRRSWARSGEGIELRSLLDDIAASQLSRKGAAALRATQPLRKAS